MAFLDRTKILGASDLPRETVAVPEWGGDVVVVTLTGTERDQFEVATFEDRKAGSPSNVRARLAVLSVRDEAGNRIFGDEDALDLGKKSAAALDRIFDVATRLNRLQDKDVKALEKN